MLPRRGIKAGHDAVLASRLSVSKSHNFASIVESYSDISAPHCLFRLKPLLLHILPNLADHNILTMSTHAYYQYAQSSYPIQMPQKPGYYYPPQQSYGRVSGSPPEAADSVTTSGVPSYEPSATSSNYAGSASDYESNSGTASVDLLDYMGNRLNGSFDPIPLDRSLAKQAQT